MSRLGKMVGGVIGNAIGWPAGTVLAILIGGSRTSNQAATSAGSDENVDTVQCAVCKEQKSETACHQMKCRCDSKGIDVLLCPQCVALWDKQAAWKPRH